METQTATKVVLPTRQKETLKEELSNILVEARMALPGMQGLFGFQTIAVFNTRFVELPTELIWTSDVMPF